MRDVPKEDDEEVMESSIFKTVQKRIVAGGGKALQFPQRNHLSERRKIQDPKSKWIEKWHK